MKSLNEFTLEDICALIEIMPKQEGETLPAWLSRGRGCGLLNEDEWVSAGTAVKTYSFILTDIMNTEVQLIHEAARSSPGASPCSACCENCQLWSRNLSYSWLGWCYSYGRIQDARDGCELHKPNDG